MEFVRAVRVSNDMEWATMTIHSDNEGFFLLRSDQGDEWSMDLDDDATVQATLDRYNNDDVCWEVMMGNDDWKCNARAINGTTDSHYDLGRYAEAKGFEVEADPDHNRRSFIARPGDEPFGDRVIGEINGDEDAMIVITADLS